MAMVKRIGTHSGSFHCDEALACFMLKKLPEYVNAIVVRTRDPKVLETCDIVVDVGGVYDDDKKLYDHHQESFTHTMSTLRNGKPWNIRLSSAGLIYHHYGEEVLKIIAGKPLEKNIVDKLFDYVYGNFMDEIDAIDNGVPMFDGEPLYGIHTHLSKRVSDLKPSWNQPSDDKIMDKQFELAMELAGSEFIKKCLKFFESWLPARKVVEDAIANRFKVHPSGEIIEMDFAPWRSHLFEIEKEENIEGVLKYVLHTDTDKSFRIAAVPIAPGSFLLRNALHPKWQGIREDDLKHISGIADAIFVHSTGFIGGAKGREGALALADKSLSYWKESLQG